MGTRIHYELRSGGAERIQLYSNCHHDTEDAEERFRALSVKHGECLSALTEDLLKQRYTVACRGHREGDRMFWVALDAGDIEKVLSIDFDQTPPQLSCMEGTQPLGLEAEDVISRDAAAGQSTGLDEGVPKSAETGSVRESPGLRTAAELRLAAADSEYARYAFGPGVEVEAASGWESSGTSEMRRSVYLRFSTDAPDAKTTRVRMKVTFANSSGWDVVSCEVHTTSGSPFGVRGRPTA